MLVKQSLSISLQYPHAGILQDSVSCNRNVFAQTQLLAECRAICCAGEGFSEEAVAASTHALATAVLDQGAVSEDACLMRAAAQLYACAACIGTDAAATQLMQTVCKDMAQTPLPAR